MGGKHGRRKKEKNRRILRLHITIACGKRARRHRHPSYLRQRSKATLSQEWIHYKYVRGTVELTPFSVGETYIYTPLTPLTPHST